MKQFNIQGNITFEVDFDVEAINLEDAKEKAKEMIEDYYHLNALGSYHTREQEIDIEAIPYSDEEEE